MAYFFGHESEMQTLLGRTIDGIEAAESTIMLGLSDGRDIVVWITEDNELAMRVEGDGVN